MNFWDERYQSNSEAYGSNPNPHLEKFLSSLDLNGKKTLFPGEGQGRNSSFACSLGADVTCFDSSEVARSQSQLLYKSKGQEVSYELAGYETFDSKVSFDIICLVYCHCTPDIQRKF